MYLVFIGFVVVFSQIKVRCHRPGTDDSLRLQSVQLRDQCEGRLPPEVIRRPKRIAFLGTHRDAHYFSPYRQCISLCSLRLP